MIWKTPFRGHFRSLVFEERNWVACLCLEDLMWTLRKKKSCQYRLFLEFRPSLIGYCNTLHPYFPRALNYELLLSFLFCQLSVVVELDLQHPRMKAN